MFEELEYKYRADNISLNDFKALMNSSHVLKQIVAASWDIYYSNASNSNSFVRLRLGEKPELTIKVKTTDGNNWRRIEIDLPLDPARLTEDTVSKFVAEFGYKENFRIFKACDIHVLEYTNFVYYVVYDTNLQEVGRFAEVEVNKEKVMELDSLAPGQAMAKLREGEMVLEKLGISAQNRLKKSLFEIFKKEVAK